MARTRVLLILAVALACISMPGYPFVPPQSQPSWSELNARQKIILAPLAGTWDAMDAFRRKKWLAIAQRYPAMGQEEQIRTQRHMAEWVKLTPEERKLAREKYKSMQRTSPKKKAAVKQKWQEYQRLPEHEKARLKAEAARHKKAAPGQTKTRSPIKKRAGRHSSHPLIKAPHPDANP